MISHLPPAVTDFVVATFDEWIPFNRVLGAKLAEVGPDRTVATLPMRPDLVGNPLKKVLHGGAVASVLDAVGGMAALTTVLARLGDDQEAIDAALNRLGTIDMRVDYLRPGSGTEFRAIAYPMRVGNTVAVTRMELLNEEEALLAVGTGTYIVG